MPRELYLVSSRAMTLTDLVEAGSQVDGSLVLRALKEGAALQLVDTDDVAVVTVDVSRQVFDTVDVEAVLGRPAPGGGSSPLDLAGRSEAGGELWWTGATAPWGPAGETGVRVVDELSVLLGASALLVEDGR